LNGFRRFSPLNGQRGLPCEQSRIDNPPGRAAGLGEDHLLIGNVDIETVETTSGHDCRAWTNDRSGTELAERVGFELWPEAKWLWFLRNAFYSLPVRRYAGFYSLSSSRRSLWVALEIDTKLHQIDTKIPPFE